MSKYKNGDYEVGKGKPPKSTQWKKGQSGNPKGRSKKQKATFEEDVSAVLGEEVEVTEGGKKVVTTKRRLLLKQIIHSALQGNPTMARLALPLLKIDSGEPDFEVCPEDEAALKAFMKRMGEKK